MIWIIIIGTVLSFSSPESPPVRSDAISVLLVRFFPVGPCRRIEATHKRASQTYKMSPAYQQLVNNDAALTKYSQDT